MAELLTIGQAAEIVGVSIDTLRRWDNDGTLPARRIGEGKQRRYRRADLDKLSPPTSNVA